MPRPILGPTIGAATGVAAALAFLARTERLGWPPPRIALLAVAFAACVGTLLGVAASGGRWARLVLRDAVGVVLGALAGLVTYVAGYLFAKMPSQPMSRDVLAQTAFDGVVSLALAELACVLVGATVGLVLARYSWRIYGLASYVAIVSIVVGYVLHVVLFALPRVPEGARTFSFALFGIETVSLGMAVLHAFYSLDVAARKRWRRTSADLPFSKYYVPRVAIHVAAYNEPTDLVISTLESVLRLDYPKDRLHVMLLDDSTDEEGKARLAAWCRERGIVVQHRAERRGYKAGALNAALEATPEEIELIAVLDADYQVEPQYLRETVGYFVDPKLGFLQTPQDYRNVGQSFLTKQYHYADAYFYRAILPSRNEENAIIFCGTMGILRRGAIEDAGGWGEEFLCEDAELSIRVLDAGYHSLYINQTYGRGLIPATFDSYRKQHHRWAYGGGQVLAKHRRILLTGRMTVRQKLDFLVGAIHWLDGATLLMMAALLLSLGVADLLDTKVVTHHGGEIWLLALVPFFLLIDGLLRLHLALRRALKPPAGATLGVMGMWMSVKLSNARGALKGALGIRMSFTRTQKAPEARVGRLEAIRRAARVTWLESLVALVLLAAAGLLAYKMVGIWEARHLVNLPRLLLAVWLAFYALVFSTAPLYAYLSSATFRPMGDVAVKGPKRAGESDEMPASD